MHVFTELHVLSHAISLPAIGWQRRRPPSAAALQLLTRRNARAVARTTAPPALIQPLDPIRTVTKCVAYRLPIATKQR